MSRRGVLLVAILAISAAIGLWGYLSTEHFRSWLASELAGRASRAIGRPTGLRVDRLRPLSLEIGLVDLHVEGEGGGEPLLTVERVEAAGLWRPLLGGRFELADLRISGLHLALTGTSGVEVDAEPAAPGWNLGPAVIRNLVVDDSSVRFTHAEIPLEIAAEDLALRARWQRGRGEYRGRVQASAGRVRWPEVVGELPVSLSSGFSLSETGLALDGSKLTGPGLEMTGRGEYRPDVESILEADLVWKATPGELPPELLRGFAADGTARGTARIRGLGSSITADLELEGSELLVGSVPVESLRGRLVSDPQGLRLTEFEGRLAGAKVSGSGRLGAEASAANAVGAELTVRADEIGPLVELLGGTGARLLGALDGEFSIEGSRPHWEALRGRYRLRVGDLRAESGGAGALQVEARGGLSAGTVGLETLRVSGPGVGVSASGSWRSSGPAELRGSARIDGWGATAELLRQFGLPLEFPGGPPLDEINGALETGFDLSTPAGGGLDWTGVRGSLDLSTRELAWIRRPEYAVAAALRLELDRGKPFLERLRLDAPGLGVTITGTRTVAAGRRYEVELEAVEISPTAATLAELLARSAGEAAASRPPDWLAGATGVRGGITLAGDVSGWRWGAAIEELAGEFELALNDLSLPGSLPGDGLSGSVGATFAGGELEIERLEARLAGVEVTGAGRLGRERADALALRLSAPTLGDSLQRLRPQLAEFAVTEGLARVPDLAGLLSAELGLSGPWSALEVEASLLVGGLEIGGRPVGAVDARAEGSNGLIRYRGQIGSPGRTLAAEGELRLGDERRITLRGRMDRQSLAPYAELAGWGDRLSGELEGRVEIAWPEGSGSGRLSLYEASVEGLPIDRLDLEWALAAETLEIVRGELRTAGGEVTFGGRLGPPPEAGTIRVVARGVQLGDLLRPFGVPLDVSGSVSLEGQVTGSLGDPRFEGRLATQEMRWAQQRRPDLSGPVVLDRSGLEIDLAAADGAAAVLWSMDFSQDGVWAATLEYPVRLVLDRWLSSDPEGMGSTLDGVLRGRLEMPAGRPEALVGRLRVDEVRLSAAGYPLRLDGGLEAILDAQTAKLLPFHLQGEGTELSIEAEVARGEELGVGLRARGSFDLRALHLLSPTLRASGVAVVDLEAAGPWPEVVWRGNVSIDDGSFQYLEFPAALNGLRARVDIASGEWVLREFSGGLGGGSLSASGRAAVEGMQLGDYRFEVQADKVQLDYPEGLRSQFDAALVFDRSASRPARISGQATVLRALYDEDVGLERSVLARRRAIEFESGLEPSWTDLVSLELVLRVPEGLWVRNDLASLEARGELDVQGSLNRPRISGRIEALEGGKIFFRDVAYYITQGSIDYAGGSMYDPRLAIRAETSVAAYDVTLAISGRLSDPVFELTSNPSLPTADIVTLLVTGSTRDQFSSSAGGLSQAQAAAYLSRGLTEKLEVSLSRSLGLDELKLDPVLVEGQTNPTARVTVGKTVTPRLSATYSSRLGTAQKDVYQAKFNLNKRLDLVGTRDEDGSLSADLRYVSSRLQRNPATVAAPAVDAGRPTIRGIDIRGNVLADDRTVSRLLALRVGDDLRQARLLDGLERVRSWYMSRAHPEADPVYQLRQVEDGVWLEIEIREGREVRLAFDGFKKTKRLERPLLELWSKSLFREEIVRDAAAKIVELLTQDGYISATAAGELRDLPRGGVEAAFSILPGPRVRVSRIAVEGESFFKERSIREQILSRRSDLMPRRLDPSLVAEDAEAIRALYASSGFIEAAVTPRIEFPKSDRRAAVTFVIEEGERYTLRSLSFSGNEEIATPALESAVSAPFGEPYSDEVLRSAEARVQALCDGLGYPDARVDAEVSFDRAAGGVDLRIMIEEGDRQYVEAVEIDNPGITRESVIRREIELEAGAPLRRAEIDATQYKLYRTGLFQSVRIEALPGAAEDQRRLRIGLVEAKNLRKEYGLGWDSEEGPRITANVSRSNVGGRRYYLGVGGKWSPVDQRVQLLLRNPAMGGSRVVGLVSTFWEDQERENFDAVRTGFSLQVGRDYRDGRISVTAGYDFAFVEEAQTVALLPMPPVSGGTTQLGSVRLGVARSTRDSSFWPTTGSYARAEASLFDSALASEAEFGRLFVQWSRYLRLPGDGTWSVGLRSGVAEPFGSSTELPISERYFAGGETSLRGFALDSLVASGTPPALASQLSPGKSLGGNALLVLNQELRFPVRDPLYAVFFYDVGNLYWKVEDLDPTDLRHSAGVGLRLRSPFGPIRLEYGWKLDRRETESAGEALFSLGLAF